MSSPLTPTRAKTLPLLLGTVVVAIALALGAASSHATTAAVSTTMHAFVHQDQSIGLTFDDGSNVGSQAATPPTIPPGTYTIRVIDDTAEHNFHLSGPGIDQQTGIGESQSPTWTITVAAGAKYGFICDLHADFMFGAFQGAGASSGGSSSGGSSSGGSSSGGSTSSGGTSSGGSTSSGGKTATGGSTSSSATLGTLSGLVGSTGKAQLTLKGKAVTKLKAGKYKISVLDSSKTGGFIIQQSTKAATTVTAAAYTGAKTVTVTLKAGQWAFYTAAGKPKTSFTVTA